MANIIESLTSMIRPDMYGAIGKTFGADSAAARKAVATAAPSLLTGLVRTARMPGGADALLRVMPSGGDGFFGSPGNVGSMLGGMMNAGSSDGPVATILGPGSNAVGAAISKAVGFNVTPLLGMMAPALLGIVGTLAADANVDGAALTAMLATEEDGFRGDAANSETVAIVDDAMEAGDVATATITTYGESWAQVVVGPAAVLYMIASADMSGPIGSVQEARAANDALLMATREADPTSVIAAAFGSGITKDHLSALKSMAPDKEALLATITSAIAAVRAHSPDQSGAYNDTLFAVATAAANAAKEGGFLGIGGTLVSTDEQVALDTLKAAIG